MSHGRLDDDNPHTEQRAVNPKAQTEEATLQGASFMVERITPVPPRHALGGADPSLVDVPTAAVMNPGPRLPQPVPPPMSGDAPPDVDTAYVPLPGQPGAAPAQAPATLVQPKVVVAGAGGLSGLLQRFPIVEKSKHSKNIRLALIAGSGILSCLLIILVFSPKQHSASLPRVVVSADTAPSVDTQREVPTAPSNEKVDPAKVEEKDLLLEKAILAVEAGRADEALAIFRRYAEEDPSPAAEYMVQLLYMQIQAASKER